VSSARGATAEEMRREVQAIRLRNAMDPKRFYRGGKADKGMPKFAQVSWPSYARPQMDACIGSAEHSSPTAWPHRRLRAGAVIDRHGRPQGTQRGGGGGARRRGGGVCEAQVRRGECCGAIGWIRRLMRLLCSNKSATPRAGEGTSRRRARSRSTSDERARGKRCRRRHPWQARCWLALHHHAGPASLPLLPAALSDDVRHPCRRLACRVLLAASGSLHARCSSKSRGARVAVLLPRCKRGGCT
jgi:hypothetical protein